MVAVPSTKNPMSSSTSDYVPGSEVSNVSRTHRLDVPDADDQPHDPIIDAEAGWLSHGLPGSADRLALVGALRQVVRAVDGAIDDILRPLELSRSRYDLLARLYFCPDKPEQMGTLGKLLHLRPSSVTKLVDGLERAGLVRRFPVAEDRRLILVQITAKGCELAKESAAALAANEFGVGRMSLESAVELRRLAVELAQTIAESRVAPS
jgi:DNA-binding MarR family transcriptional regulator